MQYTSKFQAKNTANKAMDGYVQNALMLDALVPEAHQNNRSYIR